MNSSQPVQSKLPSRTLLYSAFCILTSALGTAHAQVAPDKAISTFTVHADGLEMSLWASEPLFFNPTCMDIDHKGRVWVCESVNYRNKLHRKPLTPARRRSHRHPRRHQGHGQGGQGDHRSISRRNCSRRSASPWPRTRSAPATRSSSASRRTSCVFEDKDGDGKADGPPKKLLTGFGGFDHDHGVHGILIGPDGKLYFSVGDQGVHDLQSTDGKGRKWTSNDTDCRAGTIWRCDLDGKNLELIAHNFRNEYEPCVDSFGTVFVSDNDDDGNQQTRICYVMPGGDYGYHPRGTGQTTGTRSSPASCRRSCAPASARRPACASTRARCCPRNTGANCCTPTPARARSAATT